MVVDVIFNEGSSRCYTRSLSQYDRGTRLRFLGIALPAQFEVHFSNEEDGGVAAVVNGKNYEVSIPDAYFLNGDYIYAWINVQGTRVIPSYTLENEIISATPNSETVVDERKSNSIYEVIIPINRRPAPLTVSDGGSGIDLSDDSLNFGFSSDNESLVIGRN